MNDSNSVSDFDRVLAEVKRFQKSIGLQIGWLEKLKNSEPSPEVQIVLHYFVCDDYGKTAAWANERGWKPKTPGKRRLQYIGNDVLYLVQNPPDDLSPEQVWLIRESCCSEIGKRNLGNFL